MLKHASFPCVMIIAIIIMMIVVLMLLSSNAHGATLNIRTRSQKVTLDFSGKKTLNQAIFESTFVINKVELEKLVLEAKQSPNWPKSGKPKGKWDCLLSIPENYLVQSMAMYEELDLRTLTMSVYQKYQNEMIPLASFKVASGRSGMGTPQGNFCIKRVIQNPFYFPPPEWGKNNGPVKPGRRNPYGLWMSEILIFSNASVGYEFGPAGRLTKNSVNQHSTNAPRSIGRYASHGCVRIHPDVAARLFPFFLHYTPHRDGKKVARGTVYPFEKGHFIYVKIYTSKKVNKTKPKPKPPTIKDLLKNVPRPESGVILF